MARHLFFLLLIFLAVQPLAFAARLGPAINSISGANTLLSNATAYVSTINQSGYLIFTPNLVKSYSYLSKAGRYLNSSPQSSMLYSNLAIESARESYGNIIAYRNYAFLGCMVFTIIMGLLLLRFMKPVKREKKHRRR